MRDDFYDAYAAHEATHWWFEGRRQILFDVLARELKPKAQRRLLDVGCGTGGMFPVLASFGTADGVEASPIARAFLEQRYPAHRILPGSLPDQLPAGAWDVVTAFDVVEHVDDAVGSLRAMKACLAPGGQLVVTVPAFAFLWSQHDVVNQHKRRYTQTLLVSQLAAAGLRVTVTSYFNTLLFPAVAAARLLQRMLPAPKTEAEADADLAPTAEPLNSVLTRLFAAERHLLARVKLPMGVSLLAVAEAETP